MNDDALLEPPRAARPRARRRLGLVALSFGYRLLAGLLVASPLAALLSSSVANDPRGDAVLFDPGGLMLLEATRLAGRGAAGANAASVSITIFVTFLGLLPFAALVAGLGREGRLSRSYLAARAVRPIGTLALLWGLAALAQAIVAGLLAVLGAKLVDALHLGTPGEDFGRLGLTAVVLLAVLAVGVVRDLAAVSAVNDGTRMYTSTQRGLRVFGRAIGRVSFAYASRGVVGLGAVVGASALVMSLPGAAAGLPFVIHQLAIAVVVFAHASWLAAAIGLLQRAAPIEAPLAAVAEPSPLAPLPPAAPEALPEALPEPPAPAAEPPPAAAPVEAPDGPPPKSG